MDAGRGLRQQKRLARRNRREVESRVGMKLGLRRDMCSQTILLLSKSLLKVNRGDLHWERRSLTLVRWAINDDSVAHLNQVRTTSVLIYRVADYMTQILLQVFLSRCDSGQCNTVVSLNHLRRACFIH